MSDPGSDFFGSNGGRKAGNLRLVCRHLGCVLAPVTWASIVLPTDLDGLDEICLELSTHSTGYTKYITSVKYNKPVLQLRMIVLALKALKSLRRLHLAGSPDDGALFEPEHSLLSDWDNLKCLVLEHMNLFSPWDLQSWAPNVSYLTLHDCEFAKNPLERDARQSYYSNLHELKLSISTWSWDGEGTDFAIAALVECTGARKFNFDCSLNGLGPELEPLKARRTKPFSLKLTHTTELFNDLTWKTVDPSGSCFVKTLNWVARGPLTTLTLPVSGPFHANVWSSALSFPRVEVLVLDVNPDALSDFMVDLLAAHNQELAHFLSNADLPSLKTLQLRGWVEETGVPSLGLESMKELPIASPHVFELLSFLRDTTVVQLELEDLTSRAFREFSTPALYRHLDISWTANRGLPLLDTLAEIPSHASLITSVKVDFPRFHELAQVKRVYDENIAEMWEAERSDWPVRLALLDPDDLGDQDWEASWFHEFDSDLSERERDLWWEAEGDAWYDLVRSGNAKWIDPPASKYDETEQYEGRWVGRERLEELLTSLPNLRLVDFTNYDYGIPTLPQLTSFVLRNEKSLSRSLLPDTPNIEELVIDGDFRPPSESATPLRFPKLHTLRIQAETPESIIPLLSELFELSKATLKTFEVAIEVTLRPGQPTVAEFLANSLSTIPGLENLSLQRSRLQSGTIELVDESPSFISYLAASSLRDVDLPFLPSPLLFASLPATIERVKLLERVAENELISSIDSLLLEKARLPHLAVVEMTGGAAEEREAIVEERVEHGRVLGMKIILR
ncbi:hypothetical protein RQP46_001668 [Phenoliferia psychrophenolica]